MSEVTMRAQSANRTIVKSEFKKSEELTFPEQQVITYNFVVLREKRTDKAIDVAHTEDGLKMNGNKSGRSFYYGLPLSKVLVTERDKENRIISIKPHKKYSMSYNVYVEPFYPRKFKNPFLNMCETTWVNKALQKI
jgi:hypothetical protein